MIVVSGPGKGLKNKFSSPSPGPDWIAFQQPGDFWIASTAGYSIAPASSSGDNGPPGVLIFLFY
jgi:hypothetical protein